MGLFNKIFFEPEAIHHLQEAALVFPIPIDSLNEAMEFQTKDLEGPYMYKYVVDGEGNLWRSESFWLNDDDAEGADRIKDFFHGDVTFYKYVPEEPAGLGAHRWYSFMARFTDGRLQWVKASQYERCVVSESGERIYTDRYRLDREADGNFIWRRVEPDK